MKFNIIKHYFFLHTDRFLWKNKDATKCICVLNFATIPKYFVFNLKSQQLICFIFIMDYINYTFNITFIFLYLQLVLWNKVKIYILQNSII